MPSKVSTYTRHPQLFPGALLLPAVFALSASSPLSPTISQYLSPKIVPVAGTIFKILVWSHGAEALFVAGLCVWGGTPSVASIKWIVQTFFLGFPSWVRYLKLANKKP